MEDVRKNLNVQNVGQVCDLLDRAAQAYRNSATRSGSVVDLPDRGRLLVTGDLHDHQENFDKALHLARLNGSEDHHLVLQELIHGDYLVNGKDLSYRALVRAAALKVDRPEQVHHLLSNHELAQVRGDGILKGRVSVVEAFDEGLAYVFGGDAGVVAESIERYVKALPLALRCVNGVFCAHSLPAPRRLGDFDPTVLDRKMTEEDYINRSGSAYLMVWGRNLTQDLADTLGQCWDAEVFVLGHQHADMGYEEYGESMLILNSDHERGVALPIDLAVRYKRDELVEKVLPLAGV